ncbi:hypothetical protein PGB90_002343 [Kerria lacca]
MSVVQMSKVLRTISLSKNFPSKFQKNFVRNISFIYLRNAKQISKYKKYGNSNTHYLSSVYTTSKRFYSDDLPNHNKVLLPALSPTMDMGTIVSWAKKEGDKLNEGDLLAEIETDKATMGFETPEEGYLAKILVEAGTKDVPIGKLVCIIVEEEKDIVAFKDFVDDTPSAKPTKPSPKQPAPAQPISSPPPVQQVSAPTSQSSASKNSDRIFASPLAKRLASEQGIDLNSISSASGIFGSIKAKDLSQGTRKVIAKSTKSVIGEGYEDRPISTVQSSVATQLLQSKQTVPHYYLTVDINMDKIIKLMKKLNKSLEKEGVKLTINDFIIKATAITSMKVPEANSAWMDTFIRQYNVVDVCTPINLKDGLITPVIFDAEKKGLLDINKDLKNIIEKAKDGSLQPQEVQGGTITVSNLGMFNIKSVSSIIIPPQACLLGIGSIQKRMVPDELAPNGMKVSEILQFTLSCDHRVVDGAVGAQWLMAFQKLIEDPDNMLL